MTKLPLDDWTIKGVEGPKYALPKMCAKPGCEKAADHRHHLWRKSYVSGKHKDWVEYQGKQIPNVIGLCWQHHENVTGTVGGHEAWISYQPDMGAFIWYDKDPPTGLWKWVGYVDMRHENHPDVCPLCKQKKPRKKREELPPGEKRQRKTIRVDVPADEQDVYDELADEVAEIYGMEHYRSTLRRYYISIRAFVDIIKNKHLFVRDEE